LSGHEAVLGQSSGQGGKGTGFQAISIKLNPNPMDLSLRRLDGAQLGLSLHLSS